MSGIVRRSLRFGLAAAVGTLAAAALVPLAAQAADYDVGAIHITQPWARATPKGASAGAGYLTVINKGSEPDRLTCLSSEAAARCEIHTMSLEGGVMKMRPVEGGLEIPPGGTVTLKPSGLHVMLVDLKHPLEQGKTVEVTLKFEKAGTAVLALPIAGIGAPAPGPAAGAGGGGTMMMEGGKGGTMMMNKQ